MLFAAQPGNLPEEKRQELLQATAQFFVWTVERVWAGEVFWEYPKVSRMDKYGLGLLLVNVERKRAQIQAFGGTRL